MNGWVVHIAAGIQTSADVLLAAWTAANAIWSGRLTRLARRLNEAARAPRRQAAPQAGYPDWEERR